MNLFTQLFKSSFPQMDAVQVKERIGKNPKSFLLDVRQPEEFHDGHIAGAKLIPLGELGRRMAELPRDQEIVCVCRSGSRSSSAAGHLASAGYQVANLRGGMISWARAGLPVKKGSA